MSNHLSNQNLVYNSPIFSVSEVSNAVKRKIEENFSKIRVRGEVSGFKKATSGHLYFSLKDNVSVLDSICWKTTTTQLKMIPEDGLEVIALGRLTTYGVRSKYQMIIESIELAGEGALLKLLQERKHKLTEEGLFSDEHKIKLPFLPTSIGIITSPTGAVIRDILHRLNDRFRRDVLLWPVPVQGKEAPEKIVNAINGFNLLEKTGKIAKPDLLIIARGGGSLEDLWAFNEESVVRAAASSQIPIISAIGHEIDTTLLDYVADHRAPTPTAAAEMAVPVRKEVLAHLINQEQRKTNAINRIVKESLLHLKLASQSLPKLERITEEASQYLDDWAERLNNSALSTIKLRTQIFLPIQQRLKFPEQLISHPHKILTNLLNNFDKVKHQYFIEKNTHLVHISKLLDSYSYERVLERGFSLLRDSNNKTIQSVKSIFPGDEISATLYDGKKNLLVLDKNSQKKKKVQKDSLADVQGKLL